MLASKLVELLRERIAEHGDHPVKATWYHNEDNTPVEGIEFDDRYGTPHFELYGED